MAITDPNSVLVLGAGVSAPFGLSLGGDMISEVSNAIRLELRSADGEVSSVISTLEGSLRSAIIRNSKYHKYSILSAVASSFWDSGNSKFEMSNVNLEIMKLRELENLLRDQTSETIDDFIVENPSFARLTKICIASLFLRSCYEFLSNSNSASVRPFSQRHFHTNPTGKIRNWVHLLINIIRQGIRSGTVSKENKVKIITFNYDTILEYVLEKQFSNTEAGYSHYSDYVDIMHVHGECGNLVDSLSNSAAETCLKWAEGIHVINEKNVPDDVEQNRALAKIAVGSARELYFCGFSFAGPNCRLLGLDSLEKTSGRVQITFCNYDGNIGISKAVKKFERKRVDIEEVAGSAEKGLGVSDWLKQGNLGELPG